MSEPAPPTRLPEQVPVFPLTGVLLLPGMHLPLHIFEPRYRNMVRDALAGERCIGMIQPLVPRQDNRPPPDAEPENPELYGVGCLGFIEEAQEAEDGRYLISLKGLSRFAVKEELPLHEGYRRVVADYGPYRDDPAELERTLDPEPLLEALRAYGEANSLKVDTSRLEGLGGVAVLNALVMSLPIGPAEKQGLLEAPDVERRSRMLLDILRMGLEPVTADDEAADEDPTPPTLN